MNQYGLLEEVPGLVNENDPPCQEGIPLIEAILQDGLF